MVESIVLFEQLVQRFPGAAIDGDGVRLVVTVAHGGARVPVKLRLRKVAARGGQAVVVRAHVGPAAMVPASAALSVNAQLLAGALVVEGGDLLHRSVLWEAAEAAAVEGHLHRVTGEVAVLKVALRARSRDSEVFWAYRD